MGAARPGRERSTAVVVSAGADPARLAWDARVAAADAGLVVAADGGYARAHALGLPVDLIVGDLDSILPEFEARARSSGIPIERHPTDKDATDLELAIDAAVHRGAERVLVLDGRRGRVDHLLATVLLLGSPRWAAVQVDAYVDEARIHVVHGGNGPRVLPGTPGATVSLVVVGSDADGVRTTGLQYPLAGETLLASSTRGVSNRFVAAEARIELASGTLLVIVPEPEES